MQELKLMNRLKNTIATSNPFLVSINGFGSFPTHTIYANIETKNNLVSLVKSMKPVQSILTLDNKNKPHFITEPHLTIARKLLPWQYEKAWLEYSNTSLTASFMVNELVLLKRQVDTKKYTVAASFPLLNQPKESVQTALFV
jgi:2'-5' RNA ligase